MAEAVMVGLCYLCWPCNVKMHEALRHWELRQLNLPPTFLSEAQVLRR